MIQITGLGFIVLVLLFVWLINYDGNAIQRQCSQDAKNNGQNWLEFALGVCIIVILICIIITKTNSV